MGLVLFVAYLIAGYWSVGQTVYANKVVFYSSGYAFFVKKFTIGLFPGWILIPAAIIKKLASH